MGRFLFYMGFIVIISIKQFSPNVFNRSLTFWFFFVKKKGHRATCLPTISSSDGKLEYCLKSSFVQVVYGGESHRSENNFFRIRNPCSIGEVKEKKKC